MGISEPLPAADDARAAERASSSEEYDIVAEIGSGSYGIVYRARKRNASQAQETCVVEQHATAARESIGYRETRIGERDASLRIPRDGEVALKRFKKERNRDGLSSASIREVKFLRELDHPNIVRMNGAFFEPDANHSLCLVFDLAFSDLSVMLQRCRKGALRLSLGVVRCLFWQLVQGVNYLHKNRVVHNDLKPANILLMGNGDHVRPQDRGRIKIGDFGLAKTVPASGRLEIRKGDAMIATLWYRAPELILGSRKYDTKSDIWALGCIFGELLALDVLFRGQQREGKAASVQDDQIRQLALRLYPVDLDAEWPEASSLPHVSTLRSFLEDLGSVHSRVECLEDVVRSARAGDVPEDALELLRSMLQWDPAKRPSAERLLQHSFFGAWNSAHQEASHMEANIFDADGGVQLWCHLQGEAQPPPPSTRKAST
ncbi:Cyclin-dependent kinase E-1 [Porphyridium purpureum]|uniref:Cyclin-dependent kinase E-1 n=1 Tax=Porphyridium purpureum TaxID=35688 RepID=A0A5J4Z2T8_PORPP|nr:Cyclin-dependent kinase E-1 [Porphyridium purpureum]|eukprot:POR6550..scf208_2